MRPGESLRVLGINHSLRVHTGPAQAVASQHNSRWYLDVTAPDPGSVRQIVLDWYRAHAAAVLAGRVEHCVQHYALAVAPVRVRIGEPARSWARCTPGRQLTLSWRLVMAPLSVIDYVIVRTLVFADPALAHERRGRQEVLRLGRLSSVMADWPQHHAELVRLEPAMLSALTPQEPHHD